MLYNNDAGRKRRLQLLASSDAFDEDSELLYHIHLIDLLAKCTKGKNRYTETKCQSAVSLEDCLSAICDARLPLAVRGPWIRFFHEVFLLTEVTTMLVTEHPRMWEVLDRLHELVRK